MGPARRRRRRPGRPHLCGHQHGERPRQRSPAVVLQRVHDVAQRAVVLTDGASPVDRREASRQRSGRSGRQVGSGSPQPSQSGGVSGRIESQQARHTGPRVGWSRSAPHAAQAGARRTETNASASRRRFALHALGVAPEALEPVEHPCLRREDVDDEIEVVEQDPFGSVVAFDVRGLDAGRARPPSRRPRWRASAACSRRSR